MRAAGALRKQCAFCHSGALRRAQIQAARSTQVQSTATPALQDLTTWLENNGAPPQKLELQTMKVFGAEIDSSVAKEDLVEGDIALRIPTDLVVTLDRVLGDETVAELLTTDKVSELACLTLYLMYEKMKGPESVWYGYIKELDKQRARGQMATESPILWSEEEVQTYLRGSPVIGAVKERVAAMKNEYEALDTVWFMSGSLFNKYPYDVPTEAFPFRIFREAFAAVQSSVVHLQGVPLARRFALVPLGPPSLGYSSTCKAAIFHDAAAGEVQLRVDRSYKTGERVFAWCGPQPNSRLLLNYGIVDEGNPYDKLLLTATLPNTGPLYQVKRRHLETAGLATKQSFPLQRGKGLPPNLLPFMRLCYCTDADKISGIDLQGSTEVSKDDEELVSHLILYLQRRLERYEHTLDKDLDLISAPDTPIRRKVACRLLACEKEIWHQALDALMALPIAPTSSPAAGNCEQSLSQYSKFVQLS